MERTKALKLVGYVLTLILILNIALFAFRVIDWIVFWGVIIAGALFVYMILPKLKK